jgi:dienelactone hydrolase
MAHALRIFIALISLLIPVVSATAAEKIEFGEGEYRLTAELYRPAGNGPFPAIVAMHGCNGLYDGAGRTRPHMVDWADKLTAQGFAVLFPDSFGSRKLGSQCRVRARTVQPYRERVADAQAARHWLQAQDWIQKDRISLLGWSNGATSTLWTVRPRAEVKDAHPDFRSAVALYPGCRRLSARAWSTRMPTLILVGAADDWTPARDCEQMVAGARGRSAQTSIVKYRDAHHSFDRENLPLMELRGLAFTPEGSGGRAHIGGNAEARADALKRVPEWLKR